MNLAISSIAWASDERPAAADLLRQQGLQHVEIAPTTVWNKPLEASDADIAAHRRWWEDREFSIVALQSLNFGQPHFQIFQEADLRQQMLKYLQGITILGAKLGARVMVFGSPKNRLQGELPHDDAMAIALPFFTELGRTAADHGVTFCIEPNPTDYDCDFVTDSRSGIELVKAVNHPGFGLHLDAAGLTLAGDDPAKVIPEAMPYMHHFHLSAPYLEEVGPGPVDHPTIAQTLTDNDYNRAISVEMKPGDVGSNLPRIQRALEYVKSTYAVD